MKPAGISKLFSVFVLIFIVNLKISAQNNLLKPDVQKDSVWVAQSIATANNEKMPHPIWVNGKVLYSNDGTLRVTQLIATPDSFTTTVQYIYKGKLFKQQLKQHTDLSNYALNEIYRLPDKTPAYIFLLSKRTDMTDDYNRDWLKEFYYSSVQPADSDFTNINWLNQFALVLRLEKDSLREITIPRDTTKNDDLDTDDTDNIGNTDDSADSVSTVTDSTNVDTSSFGFTSYIKQGKYTRPYLKYDTLTHELSFRSTYSPHTGPNDTEDPCLTVSSGFYKYIDTAFVLIKDTSYYSPTLEELDTVVAQKTFKAGKFMIKAKATTGYEKDYGGYYYATLTIDYTIGKEILTSVDNEYGYDSDTTIDLKPEYRIQKNSSLIMLVSDDTNGHGPGACGAASYYESYFWSVDKSSSQQLFSFTTSSCNASARYTFTRNGEEISDSFYLKHPTSDYDADYEFNSYWKNNSTYVFEISDSEKMLLRNFYLHFNPSNKKNPVSLVAGKLLHKKSMLAQH